MLRPEAERGNRPSRSELKDLQDAPIIKSKHQPPPRRGLLRSMSRRRRARRARPEITITVLVAYTRAAASRYEDVSRDLVALAIEEANQSFRNSGRQRAAEARTPTRRTTSSAAAISSTSELRRPRRRRDGGGARTARQTRGRRGDADRARPGRVRAGDERVAAEADEAFAVVHHECAATMYSLAHEVGHIAERATITRWI